MSNTSNSDFGFLVFLGLAVIVLIAIGMGVNSFNELLLMGRILLIIICSVALIMIGIFSYSFISRKIGEKNERKITKTKNEKKKKITKVKPEYIKNEKQTDDNSQEKPKHKQLTVIEQLNRKYDL